MRIVRDLGAPQLEPGVRRAVALGTFDGVHMGHRALIAEVVERARELGVVASVAHLRPDAARDRCGPPPRRRASRRSSSARR